MLCLQLDSSPTCDAVKGYIYLKGTTKYISFPIPVTFTEQVCQPVTLITLISVPTLVFTWWINVQHDIYCSSGSVLVANSNRSAIFFVIFCKHLWIYLVSSENSSSLFAFSLSNILLALGNKGIILHRNAAGSLSLIPCAIKVHSHYVAMQRSPFS